MDYHKPDEKTLQALKDIANKLRIHSIRQTCASNSGHPTSCCSAAELMSVLFFHTMRYKAGDPRNPCNDRFILSKGHAAPILYAAWAEAGYIKASDLLNLRKIDSDLEGHPTPKLAFVDVATGSLGQGLGAACGMAYTGKYLDKSSYRVYCMLGDGECSEGSVWEAMAFASHYKLDNLVAILDVNRLGQSEPAPLQHNVNVYKERCEAFGFNTYVVDGHDVEELCKAMWHAEGVKGKPTAIVAKTFKGKGLKGIEDQDNWHGKPMPKDRAEELINDLLSQIQSPNKPLYPQPPKEDAPPADLSPIHLLTAPEYKLGDKISTRKAYGVALKRLGDASTRVVALDGDTKNSTFADMFKKAHPDRYIECFIAEQNMVSVAIGCATRERTVSFASTFAAFLARAYDQIRMAAISQSNVNLVGSHCGVSIGEDGPSQMALEDLAMFRAIPTCTVFYPSDGVSTERSVELAANTKGICFIRTSRPDTAVIYNPEEKFEIGKAKVVRQSSKDQVTVIGAGVTLHEALAAHDQLAKEGVNIRVIDPFTIKPLDASTIVASARATGGRVITVEDHYKEGGLGEAVLSAVGEEPGIVVHRLAVSRVPRSGKPQELLDMFGISAKCIVAAVKRTFAN
ncbi:transketolase-like protein 2 [Danio rerio]|uniref:transketolase n=2 Tax=Danio rerio TaxID=7955 RepID=Q6PHI8_DANRE|nr:transketolase-like protein 2 [Danio rerio]AAH56536.1 Tkt protein [Danio rerio]AAQ97969.1 transketolase [Danio rerio]|eukprot:NP_932336.3 transketolase-like protein 2 [Danio rerio]